MMALWELLVIAVGLSMDAFAIAVCKGLSVPKLQPKHLVITGLWFGGAQALMPLVKRYKEAHIEVAAYSGYTFEELIADPDKKALLECCDVLIDGEFVESEKSLDLKFRGSKNQRILDIQKSLAEGKAVLTESKRWNG